MIPILWVKIGGSEPWYEDKCFTLRFNQLKLHKRVEDPQGESYLNFKYLVNIFETKIVHKLINLSPFLFPPK